MKGLISKSTIIICIVLIALVNVRCWNDIYSVELPSADEVAYASGALPLLQGNMRLPSVTNSPLYSLFYLPFVIFLDRIDTVYVMAILLQTLLSITIFIFLIRSNINIWFSLYLALLMPLSFYHTFYIYNLSSGGTLFSLVYSFALIVWMICLIAISYRLYYLAFVLGILTIFARQDYILCFVGCIAILFLSLQLSRKSLSISLFHKLITNYLSTRNFMSPQFVLQIFLPTIFVVWIIAVSGTTNASGRFMFAFAQHYAFLRHNFASLQPKSADYFIRLTDNPWTDFPIVLDSTFPGANSVLEAFLVNPKAFIDHMSRSLRFVGIFPALIGMVMPFYYHQGYFLFAFFIYSLLLVLTTVLTQSFRRLLKELVNFIKDNRNLFMVSSSGLFAIIPGIFITAKSAYLLPSLPFFILVIGGLITCTHRVVEVRIQSWWYKWLLRSLSVFPVGLLLIYYVSASAIYPSTRANNYKHTVLLLQRLVTNNPDLQFATFSSRSAINYYVPKISSGNPYKADVMLFDFGKYQLPKSEFAMVQLYNYTMLIRPEHTKTIIEQMIEIKKKNTYEDVRIASEVQGVSVDLGDGWYGFEPTNNGRWMTKQGTLHILSASRQTVWLRMTPLAMSSEDGQGFGSRGELTVQLNGSLLRSLPIASGQAILLPLSLVPGSNVVTLQLQAPAYNPYQQGHSPDSRDLGVFFAPLELLADDRSLPLDNLPQDQPVHESHSKDNQLMHTSLPERSRYLVHRSAHSNRAERV